MRVLAFCAPVLAVAVGCGGRPLSLDAGSTPAGLPDADPAGGATIAACVTLTVAFAGCDAERLAECEREYRALPAAAQATIDADGACFRDSQYYGRFLNDTWPATPGTCAAALPVWNNWYHGGCEGDNGAVMDAIAANDSFPFCGQSGQPVCFFTQTLAP